MKYRLVKAFLAGVTGAVVLLSVSGAAAQELARSGEATIFWAHVNPAPFDPVPIGDGRIAVVATFITGTFNQTGAGFMHNMRARCVALQTIDPAAAMLEVEGYCDYQDRDGDHIYVSFWSDGPQPMAGIQTAGQFVGGSGKYTGLQGTVDISPYNPSTTQEGYGQFLGHMTVNYQLP